MLEMCTDGIRVTHLLVIPEFWKDMLGDDWLNNCLTRARFEHHLETELSKEVDGHIRRVRDQLAQSNAKITHEIVLGRPDRCLITVCEQQAFDLVVMGSPRPKGSAGLCSRMATPYIARRLKTRQLVVPHPRD